MSRGDRGSASLELAFVAPVFLLVVFVGIQAGLWAYGRSVALQSAREGVSQLRLLSDPRSAAAARPVVEAHVAQFATTLGRESLLRPAVTSRSFADAAGEPRVEVTVTGSVVSLVPGLDLTTTQRATGAVEHFGADR
ncbi:TadE family protein [Kineococcus rubinsiae]|uniref:TadE family protein n=1 Tax=Kineococcus rubinsiae TaxID=2609562 RepID=UPI001FCAC4B5|nr:TadE family protein [Kineococcus rubinsiae]